MIRIDIPQRGMIELHHAVFDVNGTLAVDGKSIPGVVDRLQAKIFSRERNVGPASHQR
jgi:hypothetical protein